MGEAFGLEPGVNTLNKLVAALKIMGADEVYDTNFGADLTVLEESEEFLDRLKKLDVIFLAFVYLALVVNALM